MRDVIKLTDDDYKTRKFKTAPAGTYNVKVSTKSSIRPGQNGNLLNVVLTITKGPHKGINIFDNIAPHVGWKIAQLLRALGIKKVGELTLQKLLKLIVGKEMRAVISEGKYNDKPQNKVTQYLPFGKESASEEDDDDEEDADEDDQDDAEDGDEDDDEDDEDADEDDDDADEDDDDDADDDDDEDDDDGDDDDDDADDDDDEDDDDAEDDDDEDDDEPAPSAKKRAVKKAAAKPKAKAKKPVAKKQAAAKKTAKRRK